MKDPAGRIQAWVAVVGVLLIAAYTTRTGAWRIVAPAFLWIVPVYAFYGIGAYLKDRRHA